MEENDTLISYVGVHPLLSIRLDLHRIQEAVNKTIAYYNQQLRQGTLWTNVTLFNSANPRAAYEVGMKVTTNDTLDECGGKYPVHFKSKISSEPYNYKIEFGYRLFTISKDSIMLYSRMSPRCVTDGLPQFCTYYLYPNPAEYVKGSPTMLLTIPPFNESASVFIDYLVVNSTNAKYHPIKCLKSGTLTNKFTHWFIPYIIAFSIFTAVAVIIVVMITLRDSEHKQITAGTKPYDPPKSLDRIDDSDLSYFYDEKPFFRLIFLKMTRWVGEIGWVERMGSFSQ
eukprot:gene3662-4214_t